MKKFLAMLLTTFCILGLTACGGNNNSTPSATATKTASAAPAENSLAGKKVLVAYFSYSGQTERVAKDIQAKTKGDLFKIETITPYPSAYRQCTEVAKAEKEQNVHPPIKGKVDNIKDYDVVFLGFPFWWHDAPMAIYTFIEQNNLSGKTDISFCTSGGSPIGESTPGLAKALSNAKFSEGLLLYSTDTDGTEKWLSKYGF